MEEIRVLIVEDEFITIEAISAILRDMNCRISGDAMSAEEAIAILDKGETDLAILDINIKGSKDGIWIGEKIKNNYNIPFIYLTAFGDDSTVKRAIETEPYGYLVKPFSKTDVYTAIEIAINNHARIERDKNESNEDVQNTLFIRSDYNFIKLSVENILFIKSDKNYLDIYLEDKKYVVRGKLSDFLENLPQSKFKKVHRSHVVNLQNIEIIGRGFIKIGQHQIPVGSDYKNELLKKINTF